MLNKYFETIVNIGKLLSHYNTIIVVHITAEVAKGGRIIKHNLDK
jgi:hypothetical protein